MKTMTSSTPMTAAVMEVESASSPRVAEMVRTSICSMSRGSAPDWISMASCWALSAVKLPSM